MRSRLYPRTLSPKEIAQVNSFIPKAVASANARIKPDPNKNREIYVSSWNQIYLEEMNSLAIAAELRTPFPPGGNDHA